MSMCLVQSLPTVTLSVTKDDNYVRWPGMAMKGRRQFIVHLPQFRRQCTVWLMRFNTRAVPYVISQMLLYSDYDCFWSSCVGLRLGVFATVLFFMAANRAPLQLRRQFWELLLERPIFDQRGAVGDEHPYIALFLAISRLDAYAMAQCGAFYHVESGKMFHRCGSKFDIYNIWGCRGIYDEGLGGTMRRVSMELRGLDVENNPLDWDAYCLLSREMVLRNSNVDCYPMDRVCDESEIDVPDGDSE